MKFRERPYLESHTIPGHRKKHKEKESKIEVPFFCMFSELDDNGKRKTEKKLGEVHCLEAVKDSKKQESFSLFELVDMSKQRPITEHKVNNVVSTMPNVVDLIKKYGINIGKAEIIFWED